MGVSITGIALLPVYGIVRPSSLLTFGLLPWVREWSEKIVLPASKEAESPSTRVL